MRSLSLVDVLDPFLVGGDRIDAHRQDLDVTTLEVLHEPRHAAKLGRAHRRVVGGMREQHSPMVAEPLMELYWNSIGPIVES